MIEFNFDVVDETVGMWRREEALSLCREIEHVASNFGAHVGLTGGLLYKDGLRKDADILIYRIRQADSIDVPGLFSALAEVGVVAGSDYGWCKKAFYLGKPIDLFFPELERRSDYKTGGFVGKEEYPNG